mmetsp:Transcript_32326/g.82384  ORF Transcript_32326/g.82384 Transcript_32326/m.82384 type:complete len:206 (+) Transcript_32326:190-807(+)
MLQDDAAPGLAGEQAGDLSGQAVHRRRGQPLAAHLRHQRELAERRELVRRPHEQHHGGGLPEGGQVDVHGLGGRHHQDMGPARARLPAGVRERQPAEHRHAPPEPGGARLGRSRRQHPRVGPHAERVQRGAGARRRQGDTLGEHQPRRRAARRRQRRGIVLRVAARPPRGRECQVRAATEAAGTCHLRAQGDHVPRWQEARDVLC